MSSGFMCWRPGNRPGGRYGEPVLVEGSDCRMPAGSIVGGSDDWSKCHNPRKVHAGLAYPHSHGMWLTRRKLLSVGSSIVKLDRAGRLIRPKLTSAPME